ncbi:MAG: hypothetical protein FD143_2336 [Ignavibacteria bacterium]|nr:MAG: hypothetical protein FD143_2336 [Ignavibacteria bacterium]KAF0159001.1 MAG: hypothetical protein FD188_2344 [Ignavibacteria bacterium]
MKKSINIFALITLMFIGKIHAQTDIDFPSLKNEDLVGGKILRAEYYAGDALWGIINGGADIYLEYGFDKLLLQEVEWNGINFRVEFYRMIDPISAFGIFSVSHFKCGRQDTLSKYVCITPFQVQCALGRFYVSIANDKGNSEAERLTINLFEKILARSKEKLFEIPERFTKPEFASRLKNLKVIKGPLGFQNSFQAWSDKFEQFRNYTVYILPNEHGEYSYSAIIQFALKEDLKQFIAQNSESKQSRIKQVSDCEILFYQSDAVDSSEAKMFFE